MASVSEVGDMVDSDRVRAFLSVTDCYAPAVAPSGDAVAYRAAGGEGTELRLYSLETDTERRLVGDLPPINREPLYWLPDGERLVSVGGGEDDQVVELVSRDGDRDELADVDGRAWLFDTEPGTAWYWALGGDEPTLYRHPVDGERERVAAVYPTGSLAGGVHGDRAVLNRADDGTFAPHVLDLAVGGERRLSDADGWVAQTRAWIGDDRLLLSRYGTTNGGGLMSGIGVYDLDDGFVWRDETVDRPVTVLPNGDALAVRDDTPVVGGPDGWTERLVDGAAVVSPMAGDEILLPDGRAVIARKSATRPRELVVLDPETGDADLLVRADFGSVDPGTVVPPDEITHPTADGGTVETYRWLPDGTEPFPTVVQQYPPQPDPTPGLDWEMQLLVDAGYAVCWLGHRGDQRTAHEDYAAAGEWLADRPWVDGDRLALYGGSSGGEGALRQAFRHPEVWTVVVAWAGPFDLVWGLEEGNLPLPGRDSVLPDFEDDPEVWRDLSPATHADGLDVPLLAMYGRQDPFFSIEQGRRLLEAVPDDAPLEYHEFDTGHGGDIDGDTAVWTTILDFLERNV